MILQSSQKIVPPSVLHFKCKWKIMDSSFSFRWRWLWGWRGWSSHSLVWPLPELLLWSPNWKILWTGIDVSKDLGHCPSCFEDSCSTSGLLQIQTEWHFSPLHSSLYQFSHFQMSPNTCKYYSILFFFLDLYYILTVHLGAFVVSADVWWHIKYESSMHTLECVCEFFKLRKIKNVCRVNLWMMVWQNIFSLLVLSSQII